MRTGGEESYLANRDRVIKAAIAEQDKAKEGGEPNNEGFRALPDFVQDKIMKRQQGGETVNLSQDMIAELIAAGADIEIL